jgi:hypothetical protein
MTASEIVTELQKGESVCIGKIRGNMETEALACEVEDQLEELGQDSKRFAHAGYLYIILQNRPC